MPSGSLGERRTGNTDVHALEHADQAALRDFLILRLEFEER